LGFDAHFNLFLKDAVEVVVVTDNSSNNNHEGIPRKTKRQLRRILVRGDTVVLCYPYRPGQAQQVV
jgi:small nuclear ribonucleoprotein (snRNP)-like protein